MVDVKPFRGCRYDKAKVSIADVISPPYDVISPAMREELYAKSPYNIARIILGTDEKGDDESRNKYTRAAEFFRSWTESGHIRQDDGPRMYVYSQKFGAAGKTFERTGLVAAVRLEDFGKNILPHEFTLSGPKVGRKLLLEKTMTNFGQIFSVYIDQKKEVDTILQKAKEARPEFDATGDDGIRHRLWMIGDESTTEKIISLMKDKKIFIADGHHRYETSLEYSRAHSENADAKYVMMTLVNMMNEGLVVFPTHRLVKDIAIDPERLMRGLESNFDVRPIGTDGHGTKAKEEMFSRMNGRRHSFGMYFGGKYFTLSLKNEKAMEEKARDRKEPWRKLDVSILHKLILEGILGIDTLKPENQSHVEYVKDVRDAVEDCIERVRRGECEIAFFMNPTRVSEVVEVAESGERMPQKSTFFYPKVYTGMVMYRFGRA